MTSTITVITGRTVTTRSSDKFITIKTNVAGDCTTCWEPMNIKKNCRTGEEILICSNKYCGCEQKLNHIKFFEEC